MPAKGGVRTAGSVGCAAQRGFAIGGQPGHLEGALGARGWPGDGQAVGLCGTVLCVCCGGWCWWRQFFGLDEDQRREFMCLRPPGEGGQSRFF